MAHEDKSMTGPDIRFSFQDQVFVAAELQNPPNALNPIILFGFVVLVTMGMGKLFLFLVDKPTLDYNKLFPTNMTCS